jgi:hypothetical protein
MHAPKRSLRTHGDYEIGAYYFPGYHTDRRVSSWHGKQWTEWDLVRAARPRFRRHRQPRIPLWGYQDEADPNVMKMKAEVASSFGINHFIYDWYFYQGEGFLNRSLDEGFLNINGGPAVKFALMWANHDWVNIHPASLTGLQPVLLSGSVGKRQFDAMTSVLVSRYFGSPHYWRINECPYFSIYDLSTLLKGLGGVEGAARAIKGFRRKVEAAGHGGLHLNLVNWQEKLVGSGQKIQNLSGVIRALGFDSLSSYVWIHHCKLDAFPAENYTSVMDRNRSYWEMTSEAFDIPFFPNVTVGWDASPRTIQTDAFENRGYPFMSVLNNNSPENFKRALLAARQHIELKGLTPKHLSINAWNEWTEGSYLEPDTANKFRYLKAIREVFGKPGRLRAAPRGARRSATG